MTSRHPVVAVSLLGHERGASGIGRYARSLLPRLVAAMPGSEFRLFVAPGDREAFAQTVAPCGERVYLETVPEIWSYRLTSFLWHLFVLPAAARRAGADVLYLPAGNRRLAPFCALPSVAVVHDLSWLHLEPKYDPLRLVYLRGVLPWMLRRSTRLIAISAATARDFAALACCPERRIVHIPDGFDAGVFHPRQPRAARAALAQAGMSLPERFALYVSRIEHPGKNHVRLLQAFRRLLDAPDTGEVHLVLAGRRANGADTVDTAVTQLGLGDRVHALGYVADDHLPWLYACAEGLVFPSLCEGFGLPVVEAQACGLPVAGADASSIPEVLGGAGLLFDPLDVDSIQDALRALFEDTPARAARRERGLENARRYSWDRTADRTAAVLRAAAARGD